jgi:hypothetical protein
MQHHYSLNLPVPRGFRERIVETEDCKYKDAIDPDGFVWIATCGLKEWLLYVPGFTHDKAVVMHETGERECPINSKNVISLGRRKVGPEKYYH